MFRCVRSKKWYVVVIFHFYGRSSSINAFGHTTLQSGNTYEPTVRRQTCCLSRASGVIVVVSGRSIVSVVFRLVRSWLFCSCSFWLRVFVARFWLVEVAFCRVGSGERWSACRMFRRDIRLHAAAASGAHGLCSGGQELVAWVQMPLSGNRHCLVFSE